MVAPEGVPGWDFARLLLSLALIVLLLRERMPVGPALLAGALIMGLAFRLGPAALAGGFTFGLARPGPAADAAPLHKELVSFCVVAVMVTLINVMGQALIARRKVQQLVASLEHLTGDTRWVLAGVPAIIGLLPTPGGAVLSAPMVGEVGDQLRIGSAEKTLANYWFRHVWEWWWPLFPAIIIILTDGYISYGQILVYMGPFTLLAILLGWFFILRPIPRPERRERDGGHAFQLGRLLGALWPVLMILGLFLLAQLPEMIIKWELPGSQFAERIQPSEAAAQWILPASVLIVNVLLIGLSREGRRHAGRIIRKGIQGRMVLLIYGVYALRAMLILTEGAERVSSGMAAFHLPALAVLFLTPFVIAVITGYNLAGISMAFPLLAATLSRTGPAGVAVAFAGSFIGILGSPVHLCLVLTREYFHAEWLAVYRRLLPMLGIMTLLAVLIGVFG